MYINSSFYLLCFHPSISFRASLQIYFCTVIFNLTFLAFSPFIEIFGILYDFCLASHRPFFWKRCRSFPELSPESTVFSLLNNCLALLLRHSMDMPLTDSCFCFGVVCVTAIRLCLLCSSA